MKELFKLSPSQGNPAKFIWQSKPYNDALKNLHEDTKERIDEIKSRSSDMTKLEKDVLRVAIETGQGFKNFEKEFNSKKPNFTNADLENLAKYTVNSISGGEVGKMYRTEMMSKINEFLVEKLTSKEISLDSVGILIEKCMAVLPYRSGSTKKALYEAMNMVQRDRNVGNKLLPSIAKKFLNKTEREKLAKKMEAGEQDVEFGEIFSVGDREYSLGECEILTGGSMTKISPKLTNSLILKNVIKIEEDGKVQFLAQLKNGCEGNLIKITPKEDDDVVPEPDPEEVKEIELTIKNLLPKEVSQYIRVNQQTKWLDYSDAFYELPFDEKEKIQEVIKLKLSKYIQDKIANGLQKNIDALPIGDPERLNLEAIQIMSGVGGNSLVNMKKARAKLIAAGAEGKEILDNMNHDLERTRQGQLLEMFRKIEASKNEAIADDWSIVKYFSEKDEISEDRINLIHAVLPAIYQVFDNNRQVKTIDEAISVLKADKLGSKTGICPVNIKGKLNDFETYWEEFKSKEGSDILSKNINDADFIKEMTESVQKNWLEIAKKMREEGQYEQAEEILRSIIMDHDDSSGKTMQQIIESKLTIEEKEKIKKKTAKKIKDQLKPEIIRGNLEEQGYLSDEGLEGFGYYNSATKKYYKKTGGAFVSAGNKEEAIKSFMEQTKQVTIDSFAKKDFLFQAADNDLLMSLSLKGTEGEALEIYKDMMGAGTSGGWDFWNFSDSNNDWLREELLTSVALLAVSGGVTGMIGAGAKLAKWAGTGYKLSRGARAVRNVGLLERMALSSVADGFVFHNVHSLASMPIVGKQSWNNYMTGVGHSMAFYGVFGAGNALFAKFAGKLAGGSGLTAKTGRFLQSAENPMRYNLGFKNASGVRNWDPGAAGKSLLAKQAPMSMEALGMTAFTGMQGFEQGGFGENFMKNWVTSNMLWMMPKAKLPEPLKEFSRRRATYDLKQYYNNLAFSVRNTARYKKPREIVREFQQQEVILTEAKRLGKSKESFLKERADGKGVGTNNLKTPKEYIEGMKESYGKRVSSAKESLKEATSKFNKNSKDKILKKEVDLAQKKLKELTELEADFHKLIGIHGNPKLAKNSSLDPLLTKEFYKKINRNKKKIDTKELRKLSVGDLRKKYKSYQFERNNNKNTLRRKLEMLKSQELIIKTAENKGVSRENFLKTRSGKFKSPQEIYNNMKNKIQEKINKAKTDKQKNKAIEEMNNFEKTSKEVDGLMDALKISVDKF